MEFYTCPHHPPLRSHPSPRHRPPACPHRPSTPRRRRGREPCPGHVRDMSETCPVGRLCRALPRARRNQGEGKGREGNGREGASLVERVRDVCQGVFPYSQSPIKRSPAHARLRKRSPSRPCLRSTASIYSSLYGSGVAGCNTGAGQRAGRRAGRPGLGRGALALMWCVGAAEKN